MIESETLIDDYAKIGVRHIYMEISGQIYVFDHVAGYATGKPRGVRARLAELTISFKQLLRCLGAYDSQTVFGKKSF